MFARPHDSAKPLHLKEVLVSVLAPVLVRLVIVVGRQRAEIGHLAPALAPDGGGPAVTLRGARRRSVELLASRVRASGREAARPANVSRSLRTRPDETSARARLRDRPEFLQALELHQDAAHEPYLVGLFQRLAVQAGKLGLFRHRLTEMENVARGVVAAGEIGRAHV